MCVYHRRVVEAEFEKKKTVQYISELWRAQFLEFLPIPLIQLLSTDEEIIIEIYGKKHILRKLRIDGSKLYIC